MALDRDAALTQAEQLLRQGKVDAAIEQYIQLIDDQPQDWSAINALGDLCLRAGKNEQAVQQFTRAGDHHFAEGFLAKAAALYKKALKSDDDNEHLVLQLAEIAERQGKFADVKHFLQRAAGLRRARGDERAAAECILRLGSLDGADVESKLAAAGAAQDIGDALRAVELMKDAADTLDKSGQHADAVRLLATAADIDPFDADLRARVAHDYLADGAANGAGRTAGENLSIAASVTVSPPAPASRATVDAASTTTPHDATSRGGGPYVWPTSADGLVMDLPELDLSTLDEPHRLLPEPIEVARPEERPEPVPDDSPDIEAVFAGFRARTAHDQQASAALGLYEQALEHLEHGLVKEAIAALQGAARVPMVRFRAAAQLGRLLIARGDVSEGIEWLERAAETPPPSPDDGYAVLYELAAALESQGESGRALAVLIELDTETGGYRDTRSRIGDLSREQLRSSGS